MTERRQKYTAEFKRDAMKLVTEQGYAIAEAARNLGLNGNMLGRWKRQLATEGEVAFPGKGRMTLEQEEVQRLRGENRRLRMERNILKKRRPSSPRNRAEICIYGGAEEGVPGVYAVSSPGSES